MRKFTEKLERRVGQKLGLKPHRCTSPKCAATRRPYAPGVHGPKKKGRRLTQRGQQMLERKKILASYFLEADALGRLVHQARGRAQALPPHNVVAQLAALLERRLDNAVWRAGFAPSRTVARQMVSHGHVFLRGQRNDIPSTIVRVGDVVSVRPESRPKKMFEGLARSFPKHVPPSWIELDTKEMSAKIVGLPDQESAHIPADLTSVVELYAR